VEKKKKKKKKHASRPLTNGAQRQSDTVPERAHRLHPVLLCEWVLAVVCALAEVGLVAPWSRASARW
jgi:hypothetical protein